MKIYFHLTNTCDIYKDQFYLILFIYLVSTYVFKSSGRLVSFSKLCFLKFDSEYFFLFSLFRS